MLQADIPTQTKSIRRGTEVRFNGDFYYTQSLTDCGFMPDREGIEYFLEPNISNKVLGDAVISSLAQFREIPWEPRYIYNEYREGGLAYEQQRTKDWVKRYGYKNKTALYQNMIECGVELKNEQITFGPTKHDALEGWNVDLRDGFVDVVIPANSHPEEIGKAVRIALSRCLNPYGEKKGLPKHNFDEYIK